MSEKKFLRAVAPKKNLIHEEVLHLNVIKTQAIVYNQDPAVIKTKSNDSVRTMAGSGIDDSVKDSKWTLVYYQQLFSQRLLKSCFQFNSRDPRMIATTTTIVI